MLDSIRKGQRWLTMIFVAVIGLVFVFFLGLGGGTLDSGPSAGAVVELDDMRLDVSDFERTRARAEERYREALGDQFDASGAQEFLDSQAIQGLVQSAILAHSAEELGLVVSKEEIQQLLKNSPNFRDENGRFAREAFEDWAEYNFGSQRNFLAVMRRDMLGQKMIRLLYSQTEVSEGEAQSAALHRLEEVEIAYVALDTQELPADERSDDAAADAYLAANQAKVREVYDTRADDFTTPEKVRARHILIQLPRDASEEATSVAQELAEAALARLQAGEDFAAVAKEVSEDPGTKDQGGELGLFGRGERVVELEEAAFALEPGQLSEVVRSDNGLHIVLLEERVAAGQLPFEEVAQQIARGLADAEAAQARAQELSEALAKAIRDGRTLEEAARDLELPIERPEAMRRRADGFVTGLGAAPEVMAAAFALTEEAPSSDRIFQIGSKRVLIQLLARMEPEPEVLAEATEIEKDRLLPIKRSRALQDWIDTDRRQLNASGRLLVNSALVTGNS